MQKDGVEERLEGRVIAVVRGYGMVWMGRRERTKDGRDVDTGRRDRNTCALLEKTEAVYGAQEEVE